MQLQDLFWYIPVMISISMVLGASGAEDAKSYWQGAFHTFRALTIGVLCVGLLIHIVARVFS